MQQAPSQDADAQYLTALLQQANAGDVASEYILGYRYEMGKGVPQDLQQAIDWYRKAAAGGFAGAEDALQRLAPAAPAQTEQQTAQTADQAPPQQVAPAQPVDDGSAQRAALEQQKQDIADKISDLQSDKDEQDSEADNWDQEAEQLGDTSNCSGPSAAICVSIAQIGVNKAQSNARKAREAAQRDQEQIDELQGQSSDLDQQISSAASAPAAQQQPAYNPNALVDLGNQQAAQIRAIGMCNACAQNGEVAQYRSQCSSGVMSACYRAAAALCQCQLNSGGCGGNVQQLQRCVDTNTQTADSMKGGYTIAPGGNSPSSNPRHTAPSGQNSQWCNAQHVGTVNAGACPGW